MLDDKKKFMSWYDWILVPLGILSIIFYVFFSSGVVLKDLSNPLCNVLLSIVNLIFTFYMTFKISYANLQKDYTTNQKKLAKTSIRHLRASQLELINLDKLIKEKAALSDNELIKQYLGDIGMHIKNIANRIILSEYDFKGIVGEELKEENDVLSRILESISQLKEKQHELVLMNDKQGQHANEKYEKLHKEIIEIKKKMNEDVSLLPFGNISPSTGILINPNGSIDITTEVALIRGNLSSESILQATGRVNRPYYSDDNKNNENQ